MTPQEKFILAVFGIFIFLIIVGTILTPINRSNESVLDQLASISDIKENASQGKTNWVCLKRYCFEVELATTARQRSKGLMDREELSLSKGMLFVFDKSGLHTFWMKNTLIPLDIIWINSDLKVAHISRHTQPCESGKVCPVVRPDQEALYVLEINAGLTDMIGLMIGDKLYFNIQ